MQTETHICFGDSFEIVADGIQRWKGQHFDRYIILRVEEGIHDMRLALVWGHYWKSVTSVFALWCAFMSCMLHQCV